MGKLLAGKKILVVEDEMLVLMEIEDMLQDLGADWIMAAATNEQALDHIAQHSFDLALLDLNLRGVRSYPMADTLFARGIPFAFVTAYGGSGLRDSDQGRQLLLKPFDSASLESMLRELLGLA
jgi:CheY-like chemotaxis protein